MSRFIFKGMMAPSFATFKPNGSLNLEIVKPYAEHLKKNGVTGVWVNGSVGEGMSMTIEERKAYAEAWLACRSDVPTVIVMCGAACLKDALELARHAESKGASGVAVIPALYEPPPTIDHLVDYMEEVAKACPRTPLFYYHIPEKTRVNLSMSEFLQKGAKRIPTLAGLKFTDRDVSGEGKKCLEVDGGSMTVFGGYDDTLQEAISVGFSCAVHSSFNFAPQLGSRIFSLMAAGDVAGAKKAQKEMCDCFDIIFKRSTGFNQACLKAAFIIMTGLQVGPPRLPVKPLTEDMTRGLKKELEDSGYKVH